MNAADKLTTIATKAQKVNECNAELEYILDARNLGRTLQENVNLLARDKSDIVNAFKSKGANAVYDMPLGVLADEVETVYNKGYSDMDLNLWKIITNNGKRTRYSRAFYGAWFPKDYSFAGEVKPTQEAGQMFYNSPIETIPRNINLSELPVSTNLNEYHTLYAFCAWCSSLTYFYDMGIPAQKDYSTVWAYCGALVTIEKVRTTKETKYNTSNAIGLAFQNCNALENIEFEGVIGQNLNMRWSTKLTHDSLMNIIECLYDYVAEGSTATHTLTLGSTNLAKLTDAEKAIATEKGWTLA